MRSILVRWNRISPKYPIEREMTMDSRVTKPVCTVVGAGPGVSLAVARRFGAAGYRVALVARRAGAVSKTAGDLATLGIDARAFAADACEEASLRKVFPEIHASLGPTEVLVYNAFGFRQANPSQLPPSGLLADFQVNVVGALISVQSVLDPMKAGSRGTILFTGGGFALEPEPMASSLAIGKAGLRNLAFSLHKELAPFHIHVATVTICGAVQDETRFSPGNISECFLRLHQQPEGEWDRELVYR